MTALNRRHAALACLLGLLATPALAETGKRKRRSTPSKPKTQKAPRTGAGSRSVRLKPSPVPTYANGQTPAERQRDEDARLRRECRGRPNAGACLGYTR